MVTICTAAESVSRRSSRVSSLSAARSWASHASTPGGCSAPRIAAAWVNSVRCSRSVRRRSPSGRVKSRSGIETSLGKSAAAKGSTATGSASSARSIHIKPLSCHSFCHERSRSLHNSRSRSSLSRLAIVPASRPSRAVANAAASAPVSPGAAIAASTQARSAAVADWNTSPLLEITLGRPTLANAFCTSLACQLVRTSTARSPGCTRRWPSRCFRVAPDCRNCTRSWATWRSRALRVSSRLSSSAFGFARPSGSASGSPSVWRRRASVRKRTVSAAPEGWQRVP